MRTRAELAPHCEQIGLVSLISTWRFRCALELCVFLYRLRVSDWLVPVAARAFFVEPDPLCALIDVCLEPRGARPGNWLPDMASYSGTRYHRLGFPHGCYCLPISRLASTTGAHMEMYPRLKTKIRERRRLQIRRGIPNSNTS